MTFSNHSGKWSHSDYFQRDSMDDRLRETQQTCLPKQAVSIKMSSRRGPVIIRCPLLWASAETWRPPWKETSCQVHTNVLLWANKNTAMIMGWWLHTMKNIAMHVPFPIVHNCKFYTLPLKDNLYGWLILVMLSGIKSETLKWYLPTQLECAVHGCNCLNHDIINHWGSDHHYH